MVQCRLQPSSDLLVAGRDNPRIVRRVRAVSRPVECRQELKGQVGWHRQRRRQDWRHAERETCQEGKDVDAEPGQAGGAGETVAARQHQDGVMAAMGDDRYDRNPGSQGELNEALPAGEIHLIPLGPRPASPRSPPGYTSTHAPRASADSASLVLAGTAPSWRRKGPMPGMANRRS